MSGWVRTQFWFGQRMRGIRISWKMERQINLEEMFKHPTEYGDVITLLFENAEIVPKGAFLVGIHQPVDSACTEYMFCHAEYPLIKEGCLFPIEDAVVELEKWEQAIELLRGQVHGANILLEQKAR